MVIREIKPEDNEQVARLIRKVLQELEVTAEGTAYTDKTIEAMYEAYHRPGAYYFVADIKGKIIGCGGIAPLEGSDGSICELQKMYFLKEVRGMGFGSEMLKISLKHARDYGFDACYLETMPHMEAAQALYQKNGFKYMDAPLGNTGHYSCPVWMLKKL